MRRFLWGLLPIEQRIVRRSLENPRAGICRTLIRQPEVNRWQLRSGDERPVEALGHGCRCVGVGERPWPGDRGVRGDRRPVRGGQVWTGLQCREKIRRGVEDDGRVGGRSGDAGKYGGLRRWQFADIAVECNPGSERQGPAIHRAGGIHSDGLVRHDGPLEHGERSNRC